jgi:hypothetical protein
MKTITLPSKECTVVQTEKNVSYLDPLYFWYNSIIKTDFHCHGIQVVWQSYNSLLNSITHFSLFELQKRSYKFSEMLKLLLRNISITCSVPPPPVLSQSSDTLTIVQGSDAFQWKSTTLSLHASNKNQLLCM